jgi:uncharacterized membrane protein YidH (DUF202 family)
MSKAKSPDTITRKAERQRRQAEKERREGRKFRWMLLGVVLLMIGGIVADICFIRWQRDQRYQRHHQQSLAKRPANTNQPASVAPAKSFSVPMPQ